jgi:LPS-assembly lipoprotein
MQTILNMQKNSRTISIIVLVCMMLTACGFQLRGIANLSFKTLYIQGANTSISRELKRAILANNILITDKVEEADLVLEMLNEVNEKRILSLSGTGVVREYELIYQVNFRTREQINPIWKSVQTVKMRRDFSFSDSALLGKSDEEARLNTDMRSDAVHEIIRRLSAIKTTPKQTDAKSTDAKQTEPAKDEAK